MWTCEYELIGTDTDGTEWYTCLVHGAEAIGDQVPCANWYPPPSPHGDGTVSPERALCEEQDAVYRATRGLGSGA